MSLKRTNPCESLPVLRIGKERTSPTPAADCSFRAIDTATGPLWPMLGQEQGALLGTTHFTPALLLADGARQPGAKTVTGAEQPSHSNSP